MRLEYLSERVIAFYPSWNAFWISQGNVFKSLETKVNVVLLHENSFDLLDFSVLDIQAQDCETLLLEKPFVLFWTPQPKFENLSGFGMVDFDVIDNLVNQDHQAMEDFWLG